MKKLIPEFIKEEREYIEDIRSKIDFERSIAIHYPTASGMKSIYIVEFKSDDPKRKMSFAFGVIDGKFDSHTNFCATAIYTPGILEKIPSWEREIRDCDYSSWSWCRRNGVGELYDRIYRAQKCQQMACPETGAFTAYKNVISKDGTPYVCELRIPAYANRSSGFERKCRTNEAKVIAMWELEFVDPDGVMHFIKTRKRVGYSCYHNEFVYRVGKTVRPTNGFNPDRFNTCTSGIHFFMTIMEAYMYRF